MLTAVCHSEAVGWVEVDDLADISELRAHSGNVVWAKIDVTGMTERDISLIAQEFDLHPLAVEDAVHTRQRPKLERYENHTFLVLDQLDEVGDQLEARQIACFLGDGYVLAMHDGAARLLNDVERRWRATGEDVADRTAFLIYTLLDVTVDDYQDIADRLESEVELLEELVLERPGAPIQRQIYGLKQQLSRVRRYALPLRRILDVVVDTRAAPAFPEVTMEFLRDVHDHLLRITDQLTNVDDLSQAVLELSRSAQVDALNEINKKLSAWAAIFAVVTIIVGTYGINYGLVPSLGGQGGFWFTLALMGVSAGALFAYFKGKGWL